MSEAETAFAEARKMIADAKATGATELNLSTAPALTRLPVEIADLTALRKLDLGNTRVADLASLSSLTALQTLSLTNTQVADLRPLVWLDQLGTRGPRGLTLSDTPAMAQDPTLARLAKIEDIAPTRRRHARLSRHPAPLARAAPVGGASRPRPRAAARPGAAARAERRPDRPARPALQRR